MREWTKEEKQEQRDAEDYWDSLRPDDTISDPLPNIDTDDEEMDELIERAIEEGCEVEDLLYNEDEGDDVTPDGLGEDDIDWESNDFDAD